MKRFLLAVLFGAAMASHACGGSGKCEAEPGPWGCTMTVTSVTNCDGSGPVTFDFVYVVPENEDRTCRTITTNSGPTYVSAQDAYVWETDNLNITASNYATGTVAIRMSWSINGDDSCIISGPVECSPQ